MELRRFIAVIWTKAWLIALAIVAVSGATYFLSITSPRIYQATAVIEINYGSDPRSDAYASLLVGERAAKTYVEQLRSPQLARDVARALALNVSPEKLISSVTVEQVRDTQLIKVSAEGATPEVARSIADQVAEAFIARTEAKQAAQYAVAKRDLDAQISDLEKQISDAQRAIAALGDPADARNASMPEFARVERTRLETTLSSYQTRYVILLRSAEDFRLAMARSSDKLSIFAPAELPRSPVRPRIMLNLIIALVSGLVLGLSAAFLLEYLDDTIKGPSEASSALGLTALGSINVLKGVRDPLDTMAGVGARKSPAAESYRILRTNFQFSGLANPHATVLLTSPGPGEGKTTTLANLGVALAQAGKRVILVDTDLRRPRLHKLFGVAREPGFTNLLLNPEMDLDEVLVPVGTNGLRLLPSGILPPNPAEILSSPPVNRIIESLREDVDLVLFDSPPVLSVADTVLLSAALKNVVMIVAGGETRTGAAVQARDELLRTNARILGVVVNKMASRRGGYYYYHRYYSSDVPASENGAAVGAKKSSHPGNGQNGA